MFDEEHMNQMVSIDPDLPALPRWQMMSILCPESFGILEEIYGPKKRKTKTNDPT